MCVVSNIGDHYRDKFQPWVYPQPQPAWPTPNTSTTVIVKPEVTKEQFEELKRAVDELRGLLLMGKEIDRKLGIADCEMDDKVEFLKALAALFDVSLEDIL